MRVVVLTVRSWFVYFLLRRLKADGIDVHTLVIENPPLGSRIGRAVRGRTIPALAALLVRKVRALLFRDRRYEWERVDAYRPLCGQVHLVRDCNSPAAEELLRALAPDVLVLGRCRILKKRIIDVPRVGVLNAHPGLLPDYRGLDPIEWAVYKGGDPGVTVHFVDSGVDTGPIVAREKIPLRRRDTVGTLYDRAADLSGRLLSGVLARLIAGEAVDPLPQRREEGERYRSMPRHLRRQAERTLARRISDLGCSGKELPVDAAKGSGIR